MDHQGIRLIPVFLFKVTGICFLIFIYLAALGLHCGAQALLWGAWLLSSGLSSCDTLALLPQGMWDLSSPTRD